MHDVIKENVGVIIVTYGNGDRLGYVKRVIHEIKQQGVNICVLVNNGVDNDLVEKELLAFGSFVNILHLGFNSGSAFGYAEGIRRMLTYSVNYIWLLDDDNLPNEGALNSLLNADLDITNKGGTPFALFALRKHRSYLMRVANGESVNNVYPRRNSVAGFHFLSILGKMKSLLFKTKDVKILQQSPIQIPYAPYGGMFFQRQVIEAIGLPDPSFYLYGDDTEFTHRVTRRGWRIFMVPSAIISDMDAVWHENQRLRIVSWVNNTSQASSFYSLRNLVYFEIHYWRDNVVIFNLNMLFFVFIVCVTALIYAKTDQLHLVFRALQDARQNTLGKKEF